MSDVVLDRIEIKGFLSISDAAVDLGMLNVLVGANGAGKSNLIRAFELLGRIVDEDLRLFVPSNGGAQALFNATGRIREIRLGLVGHREHLARNRLTYDARLARGPDDDLFFADEQISYLVPTDNVQWSSGPLDQGHRETRLNAAITDGGRSGGTALAVVQLLRGCRVYHFHDTSTSAAVKRPGPTADNLTLRPDAANLAAVLTQLRGSAAYRRIVGAVQQVAPFFRDFVLQMESTDRIRLRWREYGSDTVFSAHQMSDGTLRFVCLAALLLQPELPGIVVLDEPELGLHPYAIVQLAALLRQAARRSQVLIATQSVTLMNQLALDDLIVVERGPSGSTFTRPDAERLATWLDEYSLGELWEKNLIGGRPGSVAGSASE